MKRWIARTMCRVFGHRIDATIYRGFAMSRRREEILVRVLWCKRCGKNLGKETSTTIGEL